MASRELQTIRPPVVGPSERPPTQTIHHYASDDEALDWQDSLSAIVIRKWWWLLVVCALVSGALSYGLAMTYGSSSAVVDGSLIYAGLPPTPGGSRVYVPPRLPTYSQMLLSVGTMQKICDKHRLMVPPSRLQEHFKCNVGHNSDMLAVRLTWSDADDAIRMVNYAMDVLIDEAAERRRHILREHMKSVELNLMQHASTLSQETDKLRRLRERRARMLAEGGIQGEAYNNLLYSIRNTEQRIDTLNVDKISKQKQLQTWQERQGAVFGNLRDTWTALRQQALREFVEEKQYKEGTDRWQEVQQVDNAIADYAQEVSPESSYADWRFGLGELDGGLLPPLSTNRNADVVRYESELNSARNQVTRLELDVIPLEDQIEHHQQRLDEYKAQAKKMANDITGVSDEDINIAEQNVEAARRRHSQFSDQLENMRMLEESKTPEFAVSVPASAETTEVTSNKRKIFAFSFIGIGGILVLPVILVEWLNRRETPVQRVASRFGLPVIADRLLKDYSPRSRKGPADWRTSEAVRMLTLRIQQSAHGEASVIVVSGMRSSAGVLPLIRSVAECLAEREERVLLIDAIDPGLAANSMASGRFKILPAPKNTPSTTAESNGAGTSETNGKTSPGLAEFLSRECEDVIDLIKPTACPGVDWITSGNGTFPTEALASSCVSDLFDHCREAYTMLLVAGPPVSSQADLQMLAARADGLVLLTDKRDVNDPSCRAAVQDLVEVGAPIIGVVG